MTVLKKLMYKKDIDTYRAMLDVTDYDEVASLEFRKKMEAEIRLLGAAVTSAMVESICELHPYP